MFGCFCLYCSYIDIVWYKDSVTISEVLDKRAGRSYSQARAI